MSLRPSVLLPARFPGSLLVALLLATAVYARAASAVELWRERVKCVVAVEFYIQSETDRRPVVTGGTVIDDQGTIILQSAAIPNYLPPAQLKDFRVYLPGKPVKDFGKAEYLGYDALTTWHYIRVEPSVRPALVPVTTFAVPGVDEVGMAEDVWGIGLRTKEEDFEPFYSQNRVSLLVKLPQRTAMALGNVTAPQLPVFNPQGAFVGLGLSGFGESYFQYSRTERGSPLLLVSGDETRVFRLASEVVPYLGRVPKSQVGRPSSWLGIVGVQPLPPDVAHYLRLDEQSALVVSEVLEGGPGERAGMKERDIIVAVDGAPIPRFRPAGVAATWLEREVARRMPGEALALTVLRGEQRVELKAQLVEEPKMLREAERTYFERVGFTAREFLFVDRVANRLKADEVTGFIVHFVKPNSPAAAAGLRAEDWVREIDGAESKTFAEASKKLDAIEKDLARGEFILLISRAGETSVLRVKLR